MVRRLTEAINSPSNIQQTLTDLENYNSNAAELIRVENQYTFSKN